MKNIINLYFLLRVIFLSLVVAITPFNAYAWGAVGHQVVALVAEAQLLPHTRNEINRLLALESGATMASISTWADEHKSPSTAAWHYVNFPRGSCSYDRKRDCPNGSCVVAAISRQAEILRSAAPDEKRLVALKYLVHLVGDVYQPLHSGYADDRGGNLYQVQFLGRGTNLHAMWDSGMIEKLHKTPTELAINLLSQKDVSLGYPIDIAAVSEQSCRIVAEPGLYPDRKVGAEYIEAYGPIVQERLRSAGNALAELLNKLTD